MSAVSKRHPQRRVVAEQRRRDDLRGAGEDDHRHADRLGEPLTRVDDGGSRNQAEGHDPDQDREHVLHARHEAVFGARHASSLDSERTWYRDARSGAANMLANPRCGPMCGRGHLLNVMRCTSGRAKNRRGSVTAPTPFETISGTPFSAVRPCLR